jgi:hypothetical protein
MASSSEQPTQQSPVKDLLLIVAALACLTIALVLLLTAPARALTLSGEAAITEVKPVAVRTVLPPEQGELPLPPDSAESVSGSAANAGSATKCDPGTSFPTAFAGLWRCESLVVASAVPDVSPGQRMISQVNFVKSAEGSVSMTWAQDGWTSTLTSLRVKGDSQASTSRVNQYMTGNWSARSRDRYVKVSENLLVAESRVEQYLSGQYVGTYNTQSILYRVEPVHAISLAK